MAFWDTQSGTINKANAKGTAEVGGSSTPLPDGTKVRAIITEARWDEYEGERSIKLRWDVVDGQYKGRVVFHKVKVEEPDAKKADKHKKMLAAIDYNCGGKLMDAGVEPTDASLSMALRNVPMVIRVGLWEFNGKQGNWVQAVESAGAAVTTSVAATPVPAKVAAPSKDFDDGDIPF